MFGTRSPAAAAAASTTLAMTAPMTLESLLGLNVANARMIESNVWPRGMYAWQISDIEIGKYTIKQEDHAFVGQDAMMLTLAITCLEAGQPTLKDQHGKPVGPDEAAAFAGKVFKENIMFGNDGLPGKNGAIEHPGLNKIATLLKKILGDVNYTALATKHNNQLGTMLDELRTSGYRFSCELSHNINPKDPNKRVNAQIDLFGTFAPLA